MESLNRKYMCLWCMQYVSQCHVHPAARIAGCHSNDVTMGTMVSQITNLTTVYLTVYSGIDERKHQSSASPAFGRGIHWWPVTSPHKGPLTRKMFPFDDVIMANQVEKGDNLSYPIFKKCSGPLLYINVVFMLTTCMYWLVVMINSTRQLLVTCNWMLRFAQWPWTKLHHHFR